MLKFCYVPATSATSYKAFLAFFLLFWLRPIALLKRQTRQAVCAIDKSILLRCLWFALKRKWKRSILNWFYQFLSQIFMCCHKCTFYGCHFWEISCQFLPTGGIIGLRHATFVQILLNKISYRFLMTAKLLSGWKSLISYFLLLKIHSCTFKI